MIAQRDEIPTYREHYYVIDQYGQKLRLSERRMRERQGRFDRFSNIDLRQTLETVRVTQLLEQWVARFCRRNDLLQVGDISLHGGGNLSARGHEQYLGWKVRAVARDRRVDQAYPVGTKAPAPHDMRLLAVVSRD